MRATAVDSQQTYGEPRVNDALGYLERVKIVFRDQPEVYSQFLEIMKNFKSQALNTEGVIERVRSLFKGHSDLILGFNQFLPPGYEIELNTDTLQPQMVVHHPPTPPQPQSMFLATAPAPQPTPEFNHAINYVAKIKKRFEDDPDIYETFLQILHAYQERKDAEEAIDTVKGKVQQLFRGHTDLLEEFHYFLPETADHTIHQAVPAHIQSRNRPKRKRKEKQSKQSEEIYTGPSIEAEAANFAIDFPPNSKDDVNVFESIRRVLSRSLYIQFLQCLDLYTKEILTKAELIALIEDIFTGEHSTRATECFEKFKDTVMGYNDWDDSQPMSLEHTDFYAYLANMNSLPCKRATPSYKILPDDVIRPPCSARTPLCDSVLNDDLVSVPTGTEDSNYQTSRKNEYEEALFRVEDDRFELDRLIDSNRTALSALEKLNEELKVKPFASVSPDEFMLTIHYYAIARIYGDGWLDALALLKENPRRTVPVLIQRMQQKGIEWEKVRKQLRMPWRKVLETNYYRSLDHRSFYFKQEERKKLAARSLVNELRESHSGLSIDIRPEDEFLNQCMKFKFESVDMFQFVFDIVFQVSKEIYTAEEGEKIVGLWKGFVCHFFGMESTVKTVKHESKPLRVMLETWALQEEVAPVRRHLRASRLFYGNYTFYVFFRLLQLLYERLCICKSLCESKSFDFHQFMNILWDFFENEIDSVAFEDTLRSALGAQCFVVFTIDKLVAQLLKQMHNIALNPTHQKLIDLYFYEISRNADAPVPASLQQSTLNARMYLSNCAAIVSEHHACVQLEYFVDSDELSVGLVDGLVAPESKNVTDDWTQYLEEYLGEEDSTENVPFLKRNVAGSAGKYVQDNSLESKIDLKSYKVHYVEETEDLFFRHRAKRQKTKDLRTKRMRSVFSMA